MNEQTPIDADIEHFVHTIFAFVVLLGISFFIIGYAMGANAIHSTVASVPEGLLLIGLDGVRNQEGVRTIGCTSCTCTSTCSNVLLCALLFPHYVCKQ